MIETFLVLKWVHIVAATVLFGTGLGSAYYFWRAHRSGDVRIIATVSAHVVFADWVFTTPAVVLQPLTGFWMMALRGYSWTEPWLLASLVLFVLAGACWLPVVWLQIRLQRMAQDALRAVTPFPDRYYTYIRYWFALGWPAFTAVLVIFYLMVFKPG